MMPTQAGRSLAGFWAPFPRLVLFWHGENLKFLALGRIARRDIVKAAMSNHSASPLEPSMEDILASIRRIIAEEDEQEARNARRARPEEPPRAIAAPSRPAEPSQAEPAGLETPPAPSRPEPPRPEAPRPEASRSEASRPETPRAEASRPEPRRFRFEEPIEPPKVDWSGLSGVPQPPAAPSRPAPRAEEEQGEGWAERAFERPGPDPETKFDFEIPFRESDDKDLDADFDAILKSPAPLRPEPTRPEPPAPRVVESVYGGRFVEPPPVSSPAPTPSRPPEPQPSRPAAEDPFARFLAPPPSAFDDGYTLDPEAQPAAAFGGFAAEAPRPSRPEPAAVKSAAIKEADPLEGAEAFLRRSASESFSFAAETAEAADRAADSVAGGVKDVFSGALDFAAETADGVREGVKSAGRSVFDASEDFAEAAEDKAVAVAGGVKDVFSGALDFAAETADSAKEGVKAAGGSVFDAAADLTKSAVKTTEDLGRAAAASVSEAAAATIEAVEAATPELPAFTPPDFDLPDFASLREEVVRKTDSTRREVEDIFGDLAEDPVEPKAPVEKPHQPVSLKAGLEDDLAGFGVDRFSRDDLDDSVLNLPNDRRIPEPPPIEAAAPESVFDPDSFWNDFADPKPESAQDSPFDIPPAPAEPESAFVREELLLTERLGDVEDPASIWESAGKAAVAATTLAAPAPASVSTALAAPRSTPPAALSARQALAEDEELLSEAAERASARAMAALGAAQTPRLHGGLQLPGSEGEAESLNAVVRQMLKPMLREWLDENLPGMVERLVRAEIERVGARAAWSERD